MSTMRYSHQPFTSSKAWNLKNSPYCQNVLIQPTVGNSLKRSYQLSGLDDGDFEDIDPALILPSSKKVKYEFDDISQLKSPYPVFKTTKNTTILRAKHPLPSIRRKATWINPLPFSNVSAQRASQPFTLDAFASGAVTSSLLNVDSKPLHMRDDTVPTGWKFDIHEDTKVEEIENLLIHSATTLDISVGKVRTNAKVDRGKENVPPMDGICTVNPMSVAASTGRKNAITDRTRTPLGNLDIAEFFAGCAMDSYFIIPAEMGEE
ncbi:hypothetical protein MMC29_001571 [Sticta canariensis]|nr:hypothetical protein [Sticta canariensis]